MYTTIGKFSKSSCRHLHKTFDEAQECLIKHQNECRKSDKISDRIILEIDSLEDLDDILVLY